MSEISFQSLGLSEGTVRILQRIGFQTPTPVQASVIPEVMKGRDIVACAQTGTGKTAAFVLPALEYIAKNPGVQVLILSPTRELAEQTTTEIRRLSTTDLNAALVTGGLSMDSQARQLRERRSFVAATPGRLVDHLGRGAKLDRVGMLVLDEADRMLDMGFRQALDRIMGSLPTRRQTLLFSATLGPETKEFANKFLKDPHTAMLNTSSGVSKLVEQTLITGAEDKMQSTIELLEKEEGLVLIFVKTKWQTERIAKALSALGHRAEHISSNRTQGQRRKALDAFRRSAPRILVATDVAARGLHVDGVALVINFELPQNPEDYVHRVGRAGRAERPGKAITLLSRRDEMDYRAIMRKVPDAPALTPSARGSGPAAPRGRFDAPPRRGPGSGGGGGERSFESRGRPSFGDRSGPPSRRPASGGNWNDGPRGGSRDDSRGEYRPAREFDSRPRGGDFDSRPPSRSASRPARSGGFERRPEGDSPMPPKRPYVDRREREATESSPRRSAASPAPRRSSAAPAPRRSSALPAPRRSAARTSSASPSRSAQTERPRTEGRGGLRSAAPSGGGERRPQRPGGLGFSRGKR